MKISGLEVPHQASYKKWGKNLEPGCIQQMEYACQLPVAHSGALMPDAHTGYGLPIGGVLATENAIIPYAVGVDIACRMKMSVFDLPVEVLNIQKELLSRVLESETRFGMGVSFEKCRQHDVMDADWSVSSVTLSKKDKAWIQLGSSGGGNHFVEFGIFTLEQAHFGLEAGNYLALLSHSGSRGVGAAVADHYSKLAMSKHKNIPNELQHLSWLSMDSEEGQEYWAAMNLMGQYAEANHDCIHRHIAEAIGSEVLFQLENHHNFAWKETHFGKELFVHRKGATPAGKGVLGIIPGSMATPAFIIEGKGCAESLNSASHGAGRLMSRKQALNTFSWADAEEILDKSQVTLLSAGLDETPMVYKDIHEVMDAQQDLVEIKAQFMPKIVKMEPARKKNRQRIKNPVCDL